MRLNQFIALATGVGRRAADRLITEQRIRVNGQIAKLGQSVDQEDKVTLDGKLLTTHGSRLVTIMLNKPTGYVCSRQGQGSQTIYGLLPVELHQLKPIGRLDKDSSGLLLLTNDGQLANQLTHPRFHKQKVYEVALDKPLAAADQARIEKGLELEDGISKLALSGSQKVWTVTMHEGRNRQIRRTFAALNYQVTKLHRVEFGSYKIGQLPSGQFIDIALPRP